MSNLAQDGTGDLALTVVNGAKRLTLVTDPASCVAQKLTNRFLLFLGEWFLDVTQGLPFYQVIAVKNPDLRVLRQLFTKVILTTEGVASIQTLDVQINARRQASLSVVVKTDGGATIVGGPGPTFVVYP